MKNICALQINWSCQNHKKVLSPLNTLLNTKRLASQDEYSSSFCHPAQGTCYPSRGDVLLICSKVVSGNCKLPNVLAIFVLFSKLLATGCSCHNRKHVLATFAHEQLKWILYYQSLTTSEMEWLCKDGDGYKISASLNQSSCKYPTFQSFLISVCEWF